MKYKHVCGDANLLVEKGRVENGTDRCGDALQINADCVDSLLESTISMSESVLIRESKYLLRKPPLAIPNYSLICGYSSTTFHRPFR